MTRDKLLATTYGSMKAAKAALKKAGEEMAVGLSAEYVEGSMNTAYRIVEDEPSRDINDDIQNEAADAAGATSTDAEFMAVHNAITEASAYAMVDAPVPSLDDAPATDATPYAMPAWQADIELPTIDVMFGPPEEEAATATLPRDPAHGLVVRDALICIDGLPESASAYTRAIDLCRRLKLPVTIREAATSGRVFTVTKEHLDEMKAKTKAATKARTATPREPKERTGPSAKQQIMIDLCLRKQGATIKELQEATGWQKAAWSWMIGTHPEGKHLAGTYGYDFAKTMKDGTVTFKLSRKRKAA